MTLSWILVRDRVNSFWLGSDPITPNVFDPILFFTHQSPLTHSTMIKLFPFNMSIYYSYLKYMSLQNVFFYIIKNNKTSTYFLNKSSLSPSPSFVPDIIYNHSLSVCDRREKLSATLVWDYLCQACDRAANVGQNKQYIAPLIVIRSIWWELLLHQQPRSFVYENITLHFAHFTYLWKAKFWN